MSFESIDQCCMPKWGEQQAGMGTLMATFFFTRHQSTKCTPGTTARYRNCTSKANLDTTNSHNESGRIENNFTRAGFRYLRVRIVRGPQTFPDGMYCLSSVRGYRRPRRFPCSAADVRHCKSRGSSTAFVGTLPACCQSTQQMACMLTHANREPSIITLQK